MTPHSADHPCATAAAQGARDTTLPRAPSDGPTRRQLLAAVLAAGAGAEALAATAAAPTQSPPGAAASVAP